MATDKSKMSDKQVEAGFAGSDAKGIQQLADALKKQNDAAQKKKTRVERLDKIDELIKSTKFSDFAQRDVLNNLKDEFIASQERLQKAIEEGDEKLIALEEKNQKKLGSASSDLEKAREAEKATKKQSKLLQGIKDGVGGLGESIKNNLLPAAGIGAIALSMFDPEKLERIINSITETLVAAFTVVDQILAGDFTEALNTFKENFGKLSVLIGGLALYKFGLKKTIKGGFGFFVAAIKGGLNALKGGLGKVAAYLKMGRVPGPIGLALAALLAAIVYGEDVINRAKEEYDRTGSKFRALIAGGTELNNQITSDVQTAVNRGLTSAWNAVMPEDNQLPVEDPEKLKQQYYEKARSQSLQLQTLLEIMFNAKMDRLKNVWNAFINAPESFKQFKENAKQYFKDIAKKITKAYNDTVDKTKEIFQQVKEFPQKAKENLQKKFDEIYNMSANAIQTAMDKASTQVDAAWTKAKAKYDVVKQKAKDLFESIRSNIESAYDKAEGYISPAWKSAKKKYNILDEKAKALFQLIKDKVKEALDYVFGLIKKALGIDEEKFEKLKEKALKLGDEIYDRATTIFDSLIESFTKGSGVVSTGGQMNRGNRNNNNLDNVDAEGSNSGDQLNQESNNNSELKNNNNKPETIVVPVDGQNDNNGKINNKGGGGRPGRLRNTDQTNAFNYNSLDSSTVFA